MGRVDGEKTRAALVAAAAEEFAAHGFAEASTRAICAAAGANNALVNRYFGTKEGLYRVVARSLFGELGAPVAKIGLDVRDGAGWRAAITLWIEDMLFMTLPTEKPQRLCAALFRHEVTHPTKFHEEFLRDFGEPVFAALRGLLAHALDDEAELDLWTSSIWSQVCVYALADTVWQTHFRPHGTGVEAWRRRVRDHICESVFARLRYRSARKGARK